MSLENRQTVTCPHCGKTGALTVWQSINVQLNPEAKKSLMDGSLFSYECEECGNKMLLAYDVLYHDMEKKVMIQCAEKDEVVKSAISSWQGMLGNEPLAKANKDYRMRIVRNPNELREKVYIFDHKLDDRAIELMKVIIYTQLKSQNQDMNIDHIYLSLTEEGPTEFAVGLHDNKWGKVKFMQGMYDDIVSGIMGKVDETKAEYIIDTGWALDFLKENAPQS